MPLIIFFLLIPVAATSQHSNKNIYSRHAWAARDEWQRPGDLIRLMDLPAGARVADIGCHEGYMTFKLAREAGGDGAVYAVDIDESKLEKLRNAARSAGVENIRVIRGDPDDPKLPPGVLDAVLMLDTYHEIEDAAGMLAHIKAALKSGGRLVICDPIADERRTLPRAKQQQRHEIGMRFVTDDLSKAGFDIKMQQDPFIDRTMEKGDSMWVVVAVKP